MGRLAEMLAGEGNVHKVMLERAGQEVGIIPLSGQDLQDSQAAALQVMRDRKVDISTAQGAGIYEQELAYQMAARYLVDPNNPAELLAADVDEARAYLTPWEADELSEEFANFQARTNPTIEEMPTEDLDELGKPRPSDSESSGTTRKRSRPSSAFQRTS